MMESDQILIVLKLNYPYIFRNGSLILTALPINTNNLLDNELQLFTTHHSLFSVRAGLVRAALIDWKPTVQIAIIMVTVPVATNTHHSIPTLY